MKNKKLIIAAAAFVLLLGGAVLYFSLSRGEKSSAEKSPDILTPEQEIMEDSDNGSDEKL